MGNIYIYWPRNMTLHCKGEKLKGNKIWITTKDNRILPQSSSRPLEIIQHSEKLPFSIQSDFEQTSPIYQLEVFDKKKITPKPASPQGIQGLLYPPPPPLKIQDTHTTDRVFPSAFPFRQKPMTDVYLLRRDLYAAPQIALFIPAMVNKARLGPQCHTDGTVILCLSLSRVLISAPVEGGSPTCYHTSFSSRRSELLTVWRFELLVTKECAGKYC